MRKVLFSDHFNAPLSTPIWLYFRKIFLDFGSAPHGRKGIDSVRMRKVLSAGVGAKAARPLPNIARLFNGGLKFVSPPPATQSGKPVQLPSPGIVR